MKYFFDLLNSFGLEAPLAVGESRYWNLIIDGSIVAEAGVNASVEDDAVQVYVRDLTGSEPVDVVSGEYVNGEIKALINDSSVSPMNMALEFSRQVQSMTVQDVANE